MNVANFMSLTANPCIEQKYRKLESKHFTIQR